MSGEAVVVMSVLGRLQERARLSADDVIPRVPADPDDDVVLACALAGGATHLVSYDPHLRSLGEAYQGVRILDGLRFLYALRGDHPPYVGQFAQSSYPPSLPSAPNVASEEARHTLKFHPPGPD